MRRRGNPPRVVRGRRPPPGPKPEPRISIQDKAEISSRNSEADARSNTLSSAVPAPCCCNTRSTRPTDVSSLPLPHPPHPTVSDGQREGQRSISSRRSDRQHLGQLRRNTPTSPHIGSHSALPAYWKGGRARGKEKQKKRVSPPPAVLPAVL
ncbi:unnamed protein product [Diplocarpon coronariae]